ncbi:MAG TPA: ABC transporter permease [Puia sp.]|jgi:ABC-type antimicrobial peptide transport system permease subunit|nr:ABC transporter permease [Puia sp.]
MSQNYFTIAGRHLAKNKGYTAINIIGLAAGMAIALLIGLWATDELSFDHYAPNHSRIARGMVNSSAQGQTYSNEYISMAMGEAFRTQYSTLFSKTALICGGGDQLISSGDKHLDAPALWAQKELPEMFGFHMLRGSIAAAGDPSTALIAQSLAKALFGTKDPIGQPIRLNNSLSLSVGGVYDDLPLNTSFHRIKVILPWYNEANKYHSSNTDWEDHNGALYVELAPGVTAEQATFRVRQLPTPHVSYCTETAFLYPLDDVHLYGEFKNGRPSGGNIRFVRLFSIIGVFVLLLACINFMNLSTARSEKRAKEVGIRKTIGSLKGQLIRQFLSESILVALVALVLALVLVEITLPFFNALAAKEMQLPWSNPVFVPAIIGFALLTGLIAGSYPAFYLSSFRPIKVLKGSFRATRAASIPRQILVVLQFTVSLSLIIGTAVVYRQILFARDRPVGYSREGLFSVGINTPELSQHYEALRTDLIRSGLVADVAASDMTLTNFEEGNPLDWRGKRPEQNYLSFQNVNVSRDFGHTIGWTITRGRDFSRDFATDSSAMIINAAAAKQIGIKNPVGETVKFFGKPYTIIGVAQDMVINSPYDTAQPAIFLGDGYLSVITVRIRPGTPVRTALAGIEPIFKRYNPASPFIYKFVDADYAAKFKAEERIGNLAAVFTSLAIFISCLGLFGLASFVAEQRTREIGVRKVLGAGVLNLWGLLSKEFLRLVALSLLIAIPFSRWIMSQWLLNYNYRSSIPWWIFAAASAGILLITLATVSYQSLKAAMTNPIKSLRTE